jgi:hypothetical protein
MILSNVHDWQGDSAVKQILVFATAHRKNEFETAYAKLVYTFGKEYASDSGLGAIYKVRAVKNSDDTWTPIIRDGFDGNLIWGSHDRFPTWEQAIIVANNNVMCQFLFENFEEVLSPILNGF